jgi:hypothetical protein
MAVKAAKRPVAKKAARTASVKRRVAAAKTTKVLGRHQARHGEGFWVNNGPVCSTIPELRAAIASMSDEQFNYHTKRDGNDFARWVAEAMEHRQCAVKLEKAQTRAGALRALAICEDC